MRVVIDKEAEIERLKDMLETLTDDKDKQSVRFAINLISGFEERPTGEWIDMPFGHHCSNCHKGTIFVNREYAFCPNCGAKMKGERR